MKKIFIILISIILLTGCTNKNNTEETNMYELMENNSYTIIDVRTKEEYAEGHIKNSINIPYDEIDENISINKEDIVYVYCKSGKRASVAEETLKELGYTVYNLGSFEQIELEKE